MTFYYANSTMGFYDDALPGIVLPSDAVVVDFDTYHSIMNGQSSGLLLTTTTDGSGMPALANSTANTSTIIRVITSYSFVNRLTETERGEITIAAYEAISNVVNPDPTLTIFLDDLGAATIVDLDNQTVQEAVGLLEEIGLLTADRAAEMLADGTFDESLAGPIANV